MIFKKIYLFLLSIFVLTFISCTQNSIFDSESENSNTCSVKFCVENFSDARTIAPEVLNFSTMDETEKNEYSFVLKYKKGTSSAQLVPLEGIFLLCLSITL